MTRKDYVKLAHVIATTIQEIRVEVSPDFVDVELWAMDRLTAKMLETLKDDNPRFDSVKFMKACGF